jgi:hypothetical protein
MALASVTSGKAEEMAASKRRVTAPEKSNALASKCLCRQTPERSGGTVQNECPRKQNAHSLGRNLGFLRAVQLLRVSGH